MSTLGPDAAYWTGMARRFPPGRDPFNWDAYHAKLRAMGIEPKCQIGCDGRAVRHDGPLKRAASDGRTWVNCSDCEGSGGWMVDGNWVDCPRCEGAEGWMEPAS